MENIEWKCDLTIKGVEEWSGRKKMQPKERDGVTERAKRNGRMHA